MIAVVQRVSHAQVVVDQQEVSRIGHGFLVLLGVAAGDGPQDLEYMVRKVTGLRIFTDSQGHMNLDLASVDGSLLVVSQFTLLANTRKGKRPSFVHAMEPAQASNMVTDFVERCRNLGFTVQTGVFGADMQVSLENDGPVTIIIDSKK